MDFGDWVLLLVLILIGGLVILLVAAVVTSGNPPQAATTPVITIKEVASTPAADRVFQPGDYGNIDGFFMEYFGHGVLFIRSGGADLLFFENGDKYCFGNTCLTYIEEQNILQYSANPDHK